MLKMSNAGNFTAGALSFVLAMWCGFAVAANSVPAYVTAAVEDSGRTPWDLARDPARKPASILTFSEIKPGMVIADFVPGDGYYLRMLAKLVGPKGKVYAVVPDGGGGGARSSRMAQRTGAPPSIIPPDMGDACALGCYESGRPGYMLPVDEALAIQNITEYSNVTVLWESGSDFAVPQQLDAVFTADAYHELHTQIMPKMPSTMTGRNAQPKPLDVPALDQSIYNTLKPDGVYIVIDYAAANGSGFNSVDTLHRIDPEAVKAEILAAGFSLDGEGRALELPSGDYSTDVTGTAAERDKTDPFAFRFKKSANAPNTDKRPSAVQEATIMRNYYGNTVILNPGRLGVTLNGRRLRLSFYHPNHTYQEFGRLGEGPGPMQSGIWFWDAGGRNCELHQYPLDERSNVVCHTDVFARPIGVVQGQAPDGSGQKVEIIKGHVLRDVVPESN